MHAKKMIEAIKKSTIIIFNCEHSNNRSPFLMRLARKMDRLIHVEKYPEIAYPEMLLLNGGFIEFYGKYKVYKL